MEAPRAGETVGLLLSGGLDSGILLWELLAAQCTVRPFYIRSGLSWEPAEIAAVRALLAAAAQPRLLDLVELEMPTADVYGDHWSITGHNVPDALTPDAAVYLPGRNALLILKAALWCQLHDVSQLALAPLKSNPFPDASDEFFAALERMLRLATGRPVAILRPFAQLEKTQVMHRGSRFPLEQTFSCIDPVDASHCGRCNKCHERRQAFLTAGIHDPTRYATPT
jgi:7-cyano-7-deazaguanine synthase